MEKNNANSDGNTSRFHSIGAVDWKERHAKRDMRRKKRKIIKDEPFDPRDCNKFPPTYL